MRTIACAALAGAVFQRVNEPDHEPFYRDEPRWRIWYSGDVRPHSYFGREYAARDFLQWFSAVHGIPLHALKA